MVELEEENNGPVMEVYPAALDCEIDHKNGGHQQMNGQVVNDVNGDEIDEE